MGNKKNLIDLYIQYLLGGKMMKDNVYNPFLNFDGSSEIQCSLFNQDNQEKEEPHRTNNIDAPIRWQKDSSNAGRRYLPKLEKEKTIRTNTNSQKTYHIILKQWIKDQGYECFLKKFQKFYNSRVYFILMLDEIMKHVDGQSFFLDYKILAEETIQKKNHQIQDMEKIKPNCEHSNHLKRVIQEIQFSIKACKEFVLGNVLTSLTIVYKRNQAQITKMKEFHKAISTFKSITGYEPEDF